jgi:hypothetical protein
MVKKIQYIAIFLLVLAGRVLTAQTSDIEIRVVVVPMVKVFIGEVGNGTAEETEYFIPNLKMEFNSSGYQVVDTLEESDYNIAMNVERYDDPPPNGITLILNETSSGREVIQQQYSYDALTDMDSWNLYAVTQMMSNTPILKISPTSEMQAVVESGWPEPVYVQVPVEVPEPEPPPVTMSFSLGLRAGGNFDFFFIQNTGGYLGGVGRGFAAEGALLAELQLFRYLSLQTEAIFIYDTFRASRMIENSSEEVRYTDTFSSPSLMIPLWLKVPIALDNMVLSPFVGAYYIMPLSIVGLSSSTVEAIVPPIGVSMGFEWGIRQGMNRMFFFGMRFDRDIGLSIMGNDPTGSLEFSRTRVGVFLGYKFSLWRETDAPDPPVIVRPEEQAAPPEEEEPL